MKKSLSINFTTRQYMQSGDFELFYYNDVNLDKVSTCLLYTSILVTVFRGILRSLGLIILFMGNCRIRS